MDHDCRLELRVPCATIVSGSTLCLNNSRHTSTYIWHANETSKIRPFRLSNEKVRFFRVIVLSEKAHGSFRDFRLPTYQHLLQLVWRFGSQTAKNILNFARCCVTKCRHQLRNYPMDVFRFIQGCTSFEGWKIEPTN